MKESLFKKKSFFFRITPCKVGGGLVYLRHFLRGRGAIG
jgi:hypothetical protein